jgi:hypothetical protein
MTKREGYSKRMEHKLEAWKTRFEAGRTEAEHAGAKVKPDVREKLAACKAAGDAASSKLRELRAAAARWGEIRNEMEALWLEIENLPGDIEISARAPEETAAPPRARATTA